VAEESLRVPYLDLRREAHALRGPLRDAFERVIDRGVFLFGEEVDRFEERVARFFGVEHAVGVASGTAALEVMLLAHGIGRGDEVVTTPASFFATAKAVELVGARAVFADVCPDSYNLDPEAVERALTPRTRAILLVHLYGRPAALTTCRELADRRGILLLADVAQAFGAAIDGRPVGTWGDSAVLSFYPTKNLGALGDAGVVLTRSGETAERCRSIRFLGYSGRRDHFGATGINARMDELQAAFLDVKLDHIETWLRRRQLLSDRYDQELPREIVRPPADEGVRDARHLYVIRCRDRDGLATHLARRGIGTQVHYRVPLHLQTLFRERQQERLPVAETWCREVLSLPLYPYLEEKDQAEVVAAVSEFTGS
jgi:dTDP-4-amino-4,6-dideoxygalactose transaminase